jgi:hypothetical protein
MCRTEGMKGESLLVGGGGGGGAGAAVGGGAARGEREREGGAGRSKVCARDEYKTRIVEGLN